jgi:hypothetical protein
MGIIHTQSNGTVQHFKISFSKRSKSLPQNPNVLCSQDPRPKNEAKTNKKAEIAFGRDSSTA